MTTTRSHLDLDVADYKVIGERPLKIQIDYRLPKLVQVPVNDLDVIESTEIAYDLYSLLIDGPLAVSILDDLRRRKDERHAEI